MCLQPPDLTTGANSGMAPSPSRLSRTVLLTECVDAHAQLSFAHSFSSEVEKGMPWRPTFVHSIFIHFVSVIPSLRSYFYVLATMVFRFISTKQGHLRSKLLNADQPRNSPVRPHRPIPHPRNVHQGGLIAKRTNNPV